MLTISTRLLALTPFLLSCTTVGESAAPEGEWCQPHYSPTSGDWALLSGHRIYYVSPARADSAVRRLEVVYLTQVTTAEAESLTDRTIPASEGTIYLIRAGVVAAPGVASPQAVHDALRGAHVEAYWSQRLNMVSLIIHTSVPDPRPRNFNAPLLIQTTRNVRAIHVNCVSTN